MRFFLSTVLSAVPWLIGRISRTSSDLTGQRRSYLQWLEQGRASIPTELGYAFLFIYGLERRALVDRADQPDIFRSDRPTAIVFAMARAGKGIDSNGTWVCVSFYLRS